MKLEANILTEIALMHHQQSLPKINHIIKTLKRFRMHIFNFLLSKHISITFALWRYEVQNHEKKCKHENWIAKKDAISIIVKGTIKDPISIILNIIGYELSSSQACICKTLHAQSIT